MSVIPGISTDNPITTETETTLSGVLVGDSGKVRAATNSEIVTESELNAGLASNFGGVASSIYSGGRLSSRIYADGSSKTYSYDGFGRLSVSVHTMVGQTITLTRTYNPDGTLATIVKS